MKSTRGKYVSRSTYQKVVEENKKLIHDIKILVGDLTTGVFAVDKREVQDKWRERFKEQHDLNSELFELIKNAIINKPKMYDTKRIKRMGK